MPEIIQRFNVYLLRGGSAIGTESGCSTNCEHLGSRVAETAKSMVKDGSVLCTRSFFCPTDETRRHICSLSIISPMANGMDEKLNPDLVEGEGAFRDYIPATPDDLPVSEQILSVCNCTRWRCIGEKGREGKFSYRIQDNGLPIYLGYSKAEIGACGMQEDPKQ